MKLFLGRATNKSFTGLRLVAAWVIGIGLLVIVAALVLFLSKTTPLDLSKPIASNIFADYGVFIGGFVGTIFALASILFVIQSLNDQSRNFQRLQIENRFFEMIKIQRENSADVSIKEREGKKIFITLLREFAECLNVARPICDAYQLSKDETINVAYLCFFYGAVGPTSPEIIKRRLSVKYPEEFLVLLLRAFQTARNDASLRSRFDYEPFDGHQTRLGHYYRHLFQSVTYIDDQPAGLLADDEKYGYVKLLRAQLSNQEQALLFLNSLSDLGAPWERGAVVGKKPRRLITKFNMIKNIPSGFLQNVEPRSYYPKVRYEGDVVTTSPPHHPPE